MDIFPIFNIFTIIDLSTFYKSSYGDRSVSQSCCRISVGSCFFNSMTQWDRPIPQPTFRQLFYSRIFLSTPTSDMLLFVWLKSQLANDVRQIPRQISWVTVWTFTRNFSSFFFLKSVLTFDSTREMTLSIDLLSTLGLLLMQSFNTPTKLNIS